MASRALQNSGPDEPGSSANVFSAKEEHTPADTGSVAGAGVSHDPTEAREDGRQALRESIRAKRVAVNEARPDELAISFEHVGYAVDVAQGILCWKQVKRKYLVKNVTGTIMPGSLTAIMGPSGAGKTTLLDLLASRVVGGHFEGEILYNNKRRDKTLRRVLAYVQQEEVFFSKLTVRETLIYSARMKLPAQTISWAMVEQRVCEVLEDLNLTECADTMIGNYLMRGISGGQMKRLSIGIELIVDPVGLFLDEPTTGLDSKTALDVMSVVRHLTDQGLTVVCTIHQPSLEVFNLFDRLILLVSGETIYNGDPQESVAYFSDKGFLVDAEELNPAELIMSVAAYEGDEGKTSGERSDVSSSFFASEYRQSFMSVDSANAVRQLSEAFAIAPDAHVLSERPVFANSASSNTRYLTRRAYTMYMRDRQFWVSRCITRVVFSIIIMSVFANTGYSSSSDLRARTSVCFLSVLFFITNASYVPFGTIIVLLRSVSMTFLPMACSLRGATCACTRAQLSHVPNLRVLHFEYSSGVSGASAHRAALVLDCLLCSSIEAYARRILLLRIDCPPKFRLRSDDGSAGVCDVRVPVCRDGRPGCRVGPNGDVRRLLHPTKPDSLLLDLDVLDLLCSLCLGRHLH